MNYVTHSIFGTDIIGTVRGNIRFDLEGLTPEEIDEVLLLQQEKNIKSGLIELNSGKKVKVWQEIVPVYGKR